VALSAPTWAPGEGARMAGGVELCRRRWWTDPQAAVVGQAVQLGGAQAH